MAGHCVQGRYRHGAPRFLPMGNGAMPTSLFLICEGETKQTNAIKLSHYQINAWERDQYQVT